MNECCVIGGTGFIGSHVVDTLLSKGRRVSVVGRERVPSTHLPEGVRYIASNLGDTRRMESVLGGADEIVHLAHSSVPKTSFEDPLQDIQSNVPASVKLFDLASRLSIRKVVYVSSGGTVYGKASTLPINEDHPTNPISPYGITKLTIEKYAMMFCHLRNLPVVCVRPGNAYGERQRPFVGQGFVATAIASIFMQREILVFGDRGTIRDYVHVADVARAIVASLEHGKIGTTYNIGTGIGRDNMDVLHALQPLARSVRLEPRIRNIYARPFDVPANVLDSKRLRLDTGWDATITFEEGIQRTWRWYSESMKRKA